MLSNLSLFLVITMMNDCDLLYLLCEGPTEVTIMNILLSNDKLIFTYSDLAEFEPLHIRKASDFERDYLNKRSGKVKIIRILDSRNINNLAFKLSKAYSDKVEVINCVTSPEIEMLMIIALGKYDEFSKKFKSFLKPSEYVSQILGVSNPKNAKVIMSFFSDCDVLCRAIQEYSRVTRKAKGIHHISELLKQI